MDERFEQRRLTMDEKCEELYEAVGALLERYSSGGLETLKDSLWTRVINAYNAVAHKKVVQTGAPESTSSTLYRDKAFWSLDKSQSSFDPSIRGKYSFILEAIFYAVISANDAIKELTEEIRES